MPRSAVIIGAGPAGLTAAFELLARTDVVPTLVEAGAEVGGIARSARYGPHAIDLGGHRFFSKSARVMDWWLARLPVEAGAAAQLAYQGQQATLPARDAPQDPDGACFLVRPRRSRILHRGQLFDYPLRLDPGTLRRLGALHSGRIGLSYLRARLRPRPEHSLEDFLINRFGAVLYQTFFREYTEKVWGERCDRISADWGAQRIKSLDLAGALGDWLRRALPGPPPELRQAAVPTSLVERFLYPRRGPGQLWEQVRDEVLRRGGRLLTQARVVGVEWEGSAVRAVQAVDADGGRLRLPADFVFSSMALQDLVPALARGGPVPPEVQEIAAGLVYRDFLTVALLTGALPRDPVAGGPLPDTWLYVQEPGYQAGRVQLMHNWSPAMRGVEEGGWTGVEYFGRLGEGALAGDDATLVGRAADELARMGLVDRGDLRDGTAVRVPRAYPAYFGAYDRLDRLRDWLCGLRNLAPIGRNGLHRYNNQDHSMLTAMGAVDGIAAGAMDPRAAWAVQTGDEYLEDGLQEPPEG